MLELDEPVELVLDSEAVVVVVVDEVAATAHRRLEPDNAHPHGTKGPRSTQSAD